MSFDLAHLTPQQAADVIGVSLAFLLGEIETEKIPVRGHGAEMRIRTSDLHAYRAAVDHERRQVLNQLTAEAQHNNLGY